jgi:polysaccharide export outer membrane protein
MKSKLLLLIPLLMLSCATANKVESPAAKEPAVVQSAGLQQTDTTSAIPISEQKNPAVAQLLQEGKQDQVDEGLGVGDSISVTVWGHPDVSGVARIEKDGNLYLPLVGGISAKGLTRDQLKDKLTEAYRAYIRHPLVDIQVREYASRLVLLLGNVVKPGIYPMKGGTDLVTAIALAGGQALQSNLSSVYLLRDGHSTIVNVADYLQTGNRYNDPVIKDKDVIYVPSAEEQNVIVLGRVDKPVAIPMSGAPISIVKAIVLAGGFKLGALKNEVKVIRGGLIHPDIYTVNVDDVLHGKQPNSPQGLELYAGDIVFVPQNGLTSWNDILEQIQPTFDVLLAKPLSAATNFLLLRQLLRNP